MQKPTSLRSPSPAGDTAWTRRAEGAETWAGTGRRPGRGGPSRPSRRRCRWSPSGCVPSLSSRRIASEPTNRREPSRTPRSIHPKPSSLGVTRSASLNASRASCHSMSISGEPGLDPQRHQGLLAERPDAVRPRRPPALRRARRPPVLGHGQLEAEVAGVAGPAQRHRGVGHLDRHVVEVAQRLRLRHQRAEHGPRPRALHGEHPVALGDVLELDPHAAPELLEPRQRRPRRGQEELVGRVPEHHPVVHDVPVVVAPRRVVRLARPARLDVAHQRPGQQPLGVRPGDEVLVERRGVEDPDRVPDREVLVLRCMGVAQRRQRPLPVRVEPLVVELAQPRVERSRAHLGNATRY